MDPGVFEQLPTVYPTEEEFADFSTYVNKQDQDSQARGHGAVKVIGFQNFPLSKIAKPYKNLGCPAQIVEGGPKH